MKLTLINNLWTDENNNTWPAGIGEAEAANRSATLVNCTDCANCTGCAYCRDCTNCANCTDCTYCTGCTGCWNCTDCTTCTYCTYCAWFKSNPNRYAYGPIGSRNDTVTAYWTSKDDLWIVAGCFSGTEKQLLEKVKSTHGDNKHAVAYRKFVARLLTLLSFELSDTVRPAV